MHSPSTTDGRPCHGRQGVPKLAYRHGTSTQFRQRLVDLSIIDLMIATKLCKSWQDVIFGSRQLPLRLLQEIAQKSQDARVSNCMGGQYWVYRCSYPSCAFHLTKSSGAVIGLRTPKFQVELLILKNADLEPSALDTKRTEVVFFELDGCLNWFDEEGRFICRGWATHDQISQFAISAHAALASVEGLSPKASWSRILRKIKVRYISGHIDGVGVTKCTEIMGRRDTSAAQRCKC